MGADICNLVDANNKMNSKKPIAITIGDPAGVGAEIIRSWAFENIACCSNCVAIGHRSFLETLPEEIGKFQVGAYDYYAKLGSPDEEGAQIAFDALEESAIGCVQGRYSAVLTAPISKACMKKVGFDFQGQTEFFADRWSGVPVMSFAGEKLIVSLATWHDALKDVPYLISEANITRAVEASACLARLLKDVQEPRIAVCGLNPHAGENGIMGREEIEIINPILDKLRGRFANLSESLPPDTVFARVLKGEFDCIVSMYHDQALAPLKTIEFDNAVNVSMNLKYFRASPDHGTAFSIAGKSIASNKSFSAAFELLRKAVL